MTYTGEVVVGLFDVTKCVRARLACTIYTSVYERVIRRDDAIPEAVQREYVNTRWELSPGNRRFYRGKRVVVCLSDSRRANGLADCAL